MKRCYLFLLLGALGSAALTMANQTQPTSGRIPPTRDAFNLRSGVYKPENIESKTEAVSNKKKKKIAELTTRSNPETYSGVFQSYFEYYEFNPDGGEFLTYDVTIDIDGTTAKISNFFNLNADSYSEGLDITGEYDEEKHTITIPTSHIFDQATMAGYLYGSYPGVLLSGTIDDQGQMAIGPELVMQLSEDNKKAVVNQDFGLMMYTPEGAPQGFINAYKGAVLKVDLSQPEFVCFTDNLNFGRCYMNGSVNKSIKAFNLGDDVLNVSVSCDSESFGLPNEEYNIRANSFEEIEVAFSPKSVGDITALLVIKYGDSESNVTISGECAEQPDFSYILKEGEVKFSTDAMYPFEKTVMGDVVVAKSSFLPATGDKCYLTATVEVPEGEIGTLSWKGSSNSEMAFSAVPLILADNEEIANYAGLLNADISGSHKFGPGIHSLTFEISNMYSSYFSDLDGMSVYDVAFSCAQIEDNKAQLLTESIVFSNSLLTEGMVKKNAEIRLLNEGAKDLEVEDIITSEHFSAEVPNYSVATLEEIEIPVTFSSDASGLFKETITIVTTGGNFEVNLEALVRDMPDFQSIVKEGDFTFTTDEQNPFLVEDGKAYNSTSKVPDTEVTYCTLTASFNVPEGKIGKLSWKGHLSCAGESELGWTDYLSILIQTPYQMGYTVVPGEYDLDTKYFPYIEAPNMASLVCPPGDNLVSFTYVQYGDLKYEGEDLVEIYDLALTLMDDTGENVILENETVDFGEIYSGKKTTATVRFFNAGMTPLEFRDYEADPAFYAILPTYSTPYNRSVDVTVIFEPEEAGDWEGTISFETTAGIFDVAVKGKALSTDGFLLIEDFEDDAANWSVYDRDGDGDVWDLAWNAYGGFPFGHVHSGEECLVSFSWDYVNGTFTPDNWTFSPEFTIPEEGAFLSWWSAGDDNSRPGDVYSVYIGEGEPEVGMTFDIDAYKCVYTETIDSDVWTQHIVDLQEFAGKTVHIAFRHYACEGCYMVKIDDVFVYKYDPSAVYTFDSEKEEISTKITSIDGVALDRMPQRGVAIVTTTYSDGSSVSRKVIR